MIKSLFGVITALTLLASPAFAQVSPPPITIYTGGEGGGYDARAQVLAQRLAQRGVETRIENMNGSDEITLAACRDPNSMWIAQIDALYVREMRDGCYLVELGLYGDESAAIFFPDGSRLNELSDLDETHTVLVDRIGSGSDLAWSTMVSIEQEHGRSNAWTNVTIEYGSVRRASALATRGTIDAVFLVRTPGSDDFTRLMQAGWDLGEMYDRDIDDLDYGAKPLYERVDLRLVNARGRADQERAYLVPSFIGTTEQIERNHPDLFDAMLGVTE